MLKDKAQACVYGAFVGDSIALGAHWIYDPAQIRSQFGKIEEFMAPLPGSYHEGKKKGHFTHYGDQILVLLESIARKGHFDLDDFATRWRELFDQYTGYIDQATKITLVNFSEGKPPESSGSFSDDLAGAGRIAPLLYAYKNDLSLLVKSAISQTVMTHNTPVLIKSAGFFARVGFLVLKGESPVSAIKEINAKYFSSSELDRWVCQGMDSAGEDTISTIFRFGQSCHTPEAFPCVVHLICKYQDNFKKAMIDSVMAGGDSGGRNILVGMILGPTLVLMLYHQAGLMGSGTKIL